MFAKGLLRGVIFSTEDCDVTCSAMSCRLVSRHGVSSTQTPGRGAHIEASV